jgi:hypothetical protein
MGLAMQTVRAGRMVLAARTSQSNFVTKQQWWKIHTQSTAGETMAKDFSRETPNFTMDMFCRITSS